MTFKLDDGTELPQPGRRDIHRYSTTGARDSGPINCQVVEVEQRITTGPIMRGRMPMMITLTASANDPKWNWVAQDYLVAIVAHRASQGWEIVSVGNLGACLKRA